MTRFVAALCILIVLAAPRALPAADDPAMLAADKELAVAISKGDAVASGKLLDDDFTWTDASGKTRRRADVLASLPSQAIKNEQSADIHRYTYGQVAVVEVNSGKLHTLRLWVKRSAGWRAIVYHEVRSLDAPPIVTPGTGKECINPCTKVEFTPKTGQQKAVVTAYMALERSAFSHDVETWANLIADEFVAISANSDRVFDKATRMAELARSRMGGLAPTPLMSGEMYDFPGAVVMKSEHQPDRGRPLHVTRLWIQRNGKWVETLSYQTSIQTAPAK